MTKSIFKTVDEYGPIEVFDKGAKRYLTFGNEHEQSLQVKATPHIPQHEYGRAIMLSLLLLPKHGISSVCILGLGGGTLAQGFLNALPAAQVHVAELRMSVIKIAHHYFELPKHKHLHIHHKNGLDYIQTCKQVHQLLIADMYDENGIDDIQLSLNFIDDCHRALSDDGLLVLNYWLDHEIQTDILQHLHNTFSQVFICNSGGGNLIIYALKTDIQHDYLAKERIKPLAKSLGFSLNYYLKRFHIVG